MNRSVLVVAFVVLMCWINAPAAAQRQAKPAAGAATTGAQMVNLNTASAAQLTELPGVGLKTAELIVQYRQKNGPFKKIEEVMNIRGIGEKSFLRIKDRLTVAAGTE